MRLLFAVAILAWGSLREHGLQAQGSSSAELAAEMQSDVARLGKIVKDAGIRAD